MKYWLPLIFICFFSCTHEIPTTPEYLGEKKKWHIKYLTNPYITYDKKKKDSNKCPKVYHENVDASKRKEDEKPSNVYRKPRNRR